MALNGVCVFPCFLRETTVVQAFEAVLGGDNGDAGPCRASTSVVILEEAWSFGHGRSKEVGCEVKCVMDAAFTSRDKSVIIFQHDASC